MLSNNVKKCLELLKASKETKSLDEIWNIECQIFELMSTLDIDEKIDYTFVAKLLDDESSIPVGTDISVDHDGAGRESVHLVANETSIPDGPKSLDDSSDLKVIHDELVRDKIKLQECKKWRKTYMVNNIKEEKIKEICESLNIPYVIGSLPSIEEIKDKFQNVIIDDTAARLSDYEYSLAEQAFVFGIIYGANYRQQL